MKEKAIRALRWSERYTKTDMVYFMRGNTWLNIGRMTSILNGLILSIALAHLLTKEAYGTYAFALTVIGLFSMAQTSGLGGGITKEVALGHYAVVFHGLKKILPWSIAGAIGLGFAGLYYYAVDNTDLAVSFVVGAAVLPILISNGVAKSFFSAKGDFQTLVRFNLIRTPFATLALLIAASLSQSAVVVVVTSILTNTLMGYLLNRKMRSSKGFQEMCEAPSTFPNRFAFHTGFLSICSYISEQIDDILLWKFAGAAPVATYAYALAPVRELRSIVENPSALALPKFAQKEFSSVRTTLAFRIKQMYLIAVPLVILYILAAPFIFQHLFPRYIDAVPISQLASLSLLAAPRKFMNAAITAHQKIRESYLTIIIPSVIRVIAASILIPLFGIEGAVIALLTSEAIDYILLGVIMRMYRNKAVSPNTQ